MLRTVVVGVLAGLAGAVVAGAALGAASRALMAVVAVAAGDVVRFSWGGTLAILSVYVVAALPGALVGAFARRWWRWLLPVAGAVFLCVPAVAIAGEEVGATGHFTALQWLFVVAASLGVFATVLALPFAVVRTVDRLLQRRPARQVAAPVGPGGIAPPAATSG